MSRLDELTLAREAASHHPDVALLHLCAAWRLGPAVPLAEVMDLAGRLAGRGRWPTESGVARQHHALWMDVATRRDPADLTLLLETLFLDGRPAQWRKRLRALLAFAPDPRLLTGLFGALESPPCPPAQVDFWDSFFEVVKVLEDPRQGVLARDLMDMTLEDDSARPLRARAAALNCLVLEQPLSPEEASLCREIVEALQPRHSASNEESLVREIRARPEDDERRQVYADWLTERGNPRGEFILLQYAQQRGALAPEQQARMQELQLLHRREWLGRLASQVQLESVVFERGFPADVTTVGETTDDAPEWATVVTLRHGVPMDHTPVPALCRLLDLPDLGWLRRRRAPLGIRELGWVGERRGLDVVVGTLHSLPALPELEHLDLGDTRGAGPAAFDSLWEAPFASRLRSLTLMADPAPLGPWREFAHRHRLERLLLQHLPGRVTLSGTSLHVDSTQRSWNVGYLERFVAWLLPVLRSAPQGSLRELVVHVGRSRVPVESEKALRQEVRGLGLQRAVLIPVERGERDLLG